MMRMLAFVSLGLTGCATLLHVHRPITQCEPDETTTAYSFSIGHHFNSDRIGELVPGDSAIDDARCALGQSTGVTVMGDGSSIVSWMWSRARRTESGIVSHTDLLQLAFDSSGVFLRVLSISTM